MADWDDDSPELQANLVAVLGEVEELARKRASPSAEYARRWQRRSMRGLAVPKAEYVGKFRGEPGLEGFGVAVGRLAGVASIDVAAALAEFENELRKRVTASDFLCPDPGRPRRRFAESGH